MSNGTIGLVISALDEEGAIGDLIDGIRSTLNRNSCEVVVVDGASPIRPCRRLQRMCEEQSELSTGGTLRFSTFP